MDVKTKWILFAIVGHIVLAALLYFVTQDSSVWTVMAMMVPIDIMLGLSNLPQQTRRVNR